MASKMKRGAGLLPRLILGVFVPIFVAFLVIGMMLFVTVRAGKLQFLSMRDLGSDSLNELSAAALKESTASLNSLGEKIIQQKAEDVARQIEVYVKLHTTKPGTSLASDPRLQEIAVQKVGETGYTAVHNYRGINYFHSNPKIVGMDLHALSTKLPDFVKILDAGLREPAKGYYNWKDPDGKIRPKYMFTTPVKGTSLIVAATTYIDEFSKPAATIAEKMTQMQKTYSSQYNQRFILFSMIVLIDLAILLVAIYLYSSSIVRPIRQLAEVADKVSMGDLRTTVEVKGKGEVVLLAESIERMQTSVRAAIERLQRRRESSADDRRK